MVIFTHLRKKQVSAGYISEWSLGAIDDIAYTLTGISAADGSSGQFLACRAGDCLITVLGTIRMAAVVLVALIGVVPIFLASLYPFKIHGARASLWVVVYMTRIFNLIFNVRVHCLDAEPLCEHSGFIFINHMSYLETLALVSLGPVRYLAAMEVRVRPVTGWIAAQIGTIFVRREDRSSRSTARESIVYVLGRSHYPPLVVFPEGRLDQGDKILPFSYGAFEIAALHEIPYLVCALQYNQPEVAIWKGPSGERLSTALWRLAKSRGKIFVDIMPLYSVTPSPEDDPKKLAREARRAIAETLGLESQVPI